VVDFNENANLYGEYTINEQVEKTNLLDIIAQVLSQEEREIVLLKNSGMKMKEIASILKQPRGTISWRYSQCLDKLKSVLKEN
jgi:DNA-directed RNA polymerase specialized sigma24 family protein